ncbi:MAG TPA: nicotinate (nicotinamide) nucleotide adenylyltransferase [Planctomycetota bacterium]|nr:nicotinate (nicotinamide) nucleotide adenylyltransferase [Planctomycetota bacterium]
MPDPSPGPSDRSPRSGANSGAAQGTYPIASSGNPSGQATVEPASDASSRNLRRVGVFGGSFDPVHLGHLHVAETAQAARGLERVMFLPAAQAPHKTEQARASGADRCAMLELALRGHPDWRVDPLELERPGPSYTIDSLRLVRARWGLHPDARLFLLLGSDNLRGFARWKSIEELLLLAEPVVVARERDLRSVIETLRREAPPEIAARIERALIACEPLEVASTDIRDAFSRGELPRESLPASVAEYIAARGIYGSRRRGAPPQG